MEEKFSDQLKAAYDAQQERMTAIVREAMDLVKFCKFDDKQAGFANQLLRELDTKLREAGYRLNHLCELAAQSPRAAEEVVGG